MTAIVAVNFDWSIESCDKAPHDLNYERNTEKYGRAMKLTISCFSPPSIDTIHLSNSLTDHFSNSITEKTTKGIFIKFSQCPFKNIFHQLPISNRGNYIQIIHVRRKAIFYVLRHVHRVR